MLLARKRSGLSATRIREDLTKEIRTVTEIVTITISGRKEKTGGGGESS